MILKCSINILINSIFGTIDELEKIWRPSALFPKRVLAEKFFQCTKKERPLLESAPEHFDDAPRPSNNAGALNWSVWFVRAYT